MVIRMYLRFVESCIQDSASCVDPAAVLRSDSASTVVAFSALSIYLYLYLYIYISCVYICKYIYTVYTVYKPVFQVCVSTNIIPARQTSGMSVCFGRMPGAPQLL